MSGLGSPLKEEMATHSSILAEKSHGLTVQRVAKSQT